MESGVEGLGQGEMVTGGTGRIERLLGTKAGFELTTSSSWEFKKNTYSCFQRASKRNSK